MAGGGFCAFFTMIYPYNAIDYYTTVTVNLEIIFGRDAKMDL